MDHPPAFWLVYKPVLFLKKPISEKIDLQASGQGKIWLGCSSLIIFVVGVGLTLLYGIESGAYCFFLLIVVVVFGFMNNSKESNIVITASYISGGTVFRKITRWEKLSRVWMGQYDLLWEGKNAKGGKPYICKTSYGQFGRECQHNQSQVPIDLAIEWIELLRNASSEMERRELIQKFRGTVQRSLRAISSLAPEEQAKANMLLKELRSFSSGYREERKMEIRQYFVKKGWDIPKTKTSPLMEVFFYFYVFLLIPGCLFFIFYILFKYCLA